MKKEEVPQDQSSLSENNITEVCYALDENGNYVKVPSKGWTPKTIVQNETLQLIEERAQEALKNLKNDIASPIPYFMEINKMDLNILSDYTGIWKWRIKRHFKPNVFKRLSDKILAKYADAFDIEQEYLKNFKGE
jgi:ribosomal protein S17E